MHGMRHRESGTERGHDSIHNCSKVLCPCPVSESPVAGPAYGLQPCCVHRLAGGPWHLILPVPWLGRSSALCQRWDPLLPGGTAERFIHCSNQVTHITGKVLQFVNLLRRQSWFLPSSLLVLFISNHTFYHVLTIVV